MQNPSASSCLLGTRANLKAGGKSGAKQTPERGHSPKANRQLLERVYWRDHRETQGGRTPGSTETRK